MATSNDGSSSGEDREAIEVTPASFPATPTPLQPASIETIMVLGPLAANVEASTAQYRRHLFNTERATDAAPTQTANQDVANGDAA